MTAVADLRREGGGGGGGCYLTITILILKFNISYSEKYLNEKKSNMFTSHQDLIRPEVAKRKCELILFTPHFFAVLLFFSHLAY